MNNKLTIKWNTKAIILYTLYWIMAIIMVVLVAIISPLHILIGFCVRGFSYKDSNLASNTISYLHDKHESLEAKLTPNSAHRLCPYYNSGKCTIFKEYYESIGYKSPSEYRKVDNMRCLCPTNRFRCDRSQKKKMLENRVNGR